MTEPASAWPVSEHGLLAAWPGAERWRVLAARHPIVVDVLLAGCLLPLAVLGGHRGVVAGTRPYLVGIGLVLVATLALRRRFPLTVLGVVSGLSLLLGALGPELPPVSVGVLVAVYTVGAYAGRKQAQFAVLLLAVLVAVEVWGHDEFAEVVAHFVVVFAVVVAAFVLGVNIRTRRAYLVFLRDRAVRAERDLDQQAQLAAARERALIAREMHDIVAHNLSVMVALADGAAFAARTGAADAETAARLVGTTGRQALEEMHRLLGVLRSNGDESPRAPQPGIAQVEELVEQVRVAGLPTTWTVTGKPFPLSPTAGLAVYRIAQEALTNVLKHAKTPSGARLRIAYDDPFVTLEVVDDGVGPRPGTGAPGHGLTGMRERVAVFGGEVEAGPRPAGGWKVTARVGAGHPAQEVPA
ncbi:sensor histidine kinase [Amycolatopsis sp. NBC_01488]|uniref:sensor histidine kinase n=1 Tax=Amycolatopsis sp. NBC_01488 TaxID=2903563 RepID=UPI002E2E54AC|nr:sensor histidine kinase [Amycolatopsis sp. NBC_01488]